MSRVSHLLLAVLATTSSACGGRTTAVEAGDVSPEIVVRAEVVARDGVAEVRAPHAAVVSSVYAAEGQTVTRGAQLAELRYEGSLDVLTVRAPIDGVVIRRDATVGDDVRAGDPPLFEIADLTHVELRFELDDADASRVATGAPVTVLTPGRSEPLAEATVARLSAGMEERRLGRGDARVRASGRVRVGWVELAGGEELPIGRELDLRIGLPTVHAAARVERAAIILVDGEPVVRRPGTWSDDLVPVSVLSVDRNYAEIEGVAPGTVVRLP